jgi:Fic family protein
MERDITANYHGGNPESVEAFESFSVERMESDRARIVRLTIVRGKHGLTCDEAERLLGLKHQTCSARFTDLVKDGRLTRTEERRPTRSGCPARVHIVE